MIKLADLLKEWTNSEYEKASNANISDYGRDPFQQKFGLANFKNYNIGFAPLQYEQDEKDLALVKKIADSLGMGWEDVMEVGSIKHSDDHHFSVKTSNMKYPGFSVEKSQDGSKATVYIEGSNKKFTINTTKK
jgi:hypothetical protein